MNQYTGILHASVIVSDTAKALEFYCGVMGMEIAERPKSMSFPGAWLQVGAQQIHLLELPNPDPVTRRPAHGGRDRHVALGIADLGALAARLESAGVRFTVSRSGRRALFCRDPDGNALELVELTAD